jgi:hypothetical protein
MKCTWEGRCEGKKRDSVVDREGERLEKHTPGLRDIQQGTLEQ